MKEKATVASPRRVMGFCERHDHKHVIELHSSLRHRALAEKHGIHVNENELVYRPVTGFTFRRNAPVN